MKSALVLSIALVASLTAPAPAPRKTPTTPRPATHDWVAIIGNPKPNERFVLEGRVLDSDGQPVRGLHLEVHHANGQGHDFESTTGFDRKFACEGTLRTNVAGEYRVETELPGLVGEVPHLEFQVEGAKTRFAPCTLNLARNSGPGTDEVYGRLPWMLTLPGTSWAYVARDGDGVLHCHYDIQLTD